MPEDTSNSTQGGPIRPLPANLGSVWDDELGAWVRCSDGAVWDDEEFEWLPSSKSVGVAYGT